MENEINSARVKNSASQHSSVHRSPSLLGKSNSPWLPLGNSSPGYVLNGLILKGPVLPVLRGTEAHSHIRESATRPKPLARRTLARTAEREFWLRHENPCKGVVPSG